MAVDPNFATTATGTATASTRPISPLPHQPHATIRGPNHHDPFLYPVSSSGRGFIVPNPNPKGLRPSPSPSLAAYSQGVRAHLDYLHHITRHYPHVPPSPSLSLSPSPSPPIRPLPLSPHPHPKAAPRSAISDSNGYKDTSTRERSRDDTCYVIRDRKVRITEDASLYALCRSWLRNGLNEENQSLQKDVMKALPKPLPAAMVAGYMSNKKEEEENDNEHEENEESVEHLSPQDLLKRHIKRAKKVRARLREERLQRITRYRSRLRLLLPPPVEHFRNDTAAGN